MDVSTLIIIVALLILFVLIIYVLIKLSKIKKTIIPGGETQKQTPPTENGEPSILGAVLKVMHEQNVITEEKRQKKREEIWRDINNAWKIRPRR